MSLFRPTCKAAFLGAVLIAGLTTGLSVTRPATAEEVGRVGVDWVGNDIIIEALPDPRFRV